MAGQRNADNAPVTSPDWSICAVKSVTFDGTTGKGAVGASTLFSVTGACLVRLFGKVTASLTATSRSPSASLSPSSSASASLSPSSSVSVSASVSPSASTSPSGSTSASVSASTSPSSSASSSRSTSRSPSSSASPSSSVSPSASASLSRSPSSSASASVSPSASASKSLSPSSSLSPSASTSPSSSSSASPSPGSSGELAIGTATNPTGLVTTTEGYLLQTNRIWVDASPSTTVEPITSAAQQIVTEDVILTVTTAGVYGGSMDVYACYFPLGQNSNLVAA